MYQTDLTDKQWNCIKPYFKRSDARGARSKHSKREIANAIFYIVRTGVQWRYLPKDMPPWQTVYDHFRRLNKRGIWKLILAELTKKFRVISGRNPNPSYAIIDAQSVKTQYHGKERGYDGGKKNKRS